MINSYTLDCVDVILYMIQYNLEWGAALALFKEIQALGWLNFVTGADLLWLVSRAIYSPMDMVISLNGLSSRRIQEVDLFPILIPPLFTSPLRTYLVQYLRQYILAH